MTTIDRTATELAIGLVTANVQNNQELVRTMMAAIAETQDGIGVLTALGILASVVSQFVILACQLDDTMSAEDYWAHYAAVLVPHLDTIDWESP